MECEVMSKTYEQLKVLPGAARVIGEVELFEKTHGFYITAFTAAMITAGETDATLISKAESVKVTKAAGSQWNAGQWVYWDEGNSNFTNIPASDRFCVGKVQQYAANAAEIGFISLQDNYHPIQLGTTAVPVVLTAGQKVVDIHVSSAIVENVEAFTMEMIMSGVGATGGRAKFTLSTEVALGGWVNALKAVLDFGTNGSVTGLCSAFCAELVAAVTPFPVGYYAALEAEIVMPTGAVSNIGAPLSYLFCGLGGTDKQAFLDGGYFLTMTNMGVASGDIFYVNTTTATLKCLIDNVEYFMQFHKVEAAT